MRKLKYILLLLIAISCTKEVEVLNPINAENVKKIAELQSQLSWLTSSLSGLQSQNQNLTNERNSLQEQLNSLQEQLTSLQSQLSTLEGTNASLESQITALEETNTSLESQIESLKIKVAELGLAVAINIGVQDGVYTQSEGGFYTIVNNDTVFDSSYSPSTKIYAVIEKGSLKKITRDLKVEIYNDPTNDVPFTQWVMRHGLGDGDTVDNFKDSIYVSNLDEIIIEYEFLGNISVYDADNFKDSIYENAISKTVKKWVKNKELTEETVPAQTFLEINKFIMENATVGTFSDSIYKNIDPFDPISLREGFILDAERNGLDISYLRDEEITLETVDWNRGAAYGSPCQTGVIQVYREQEWEPIIKPLQNSALWVMFHEMGHAALNLAHNNISGDIMCCSSEFSVENIRDKTRRMFQNIEQISYDCGFATQKGGGTIIVD